ncbi:competence type IV pilus major pilin ComGC [Peribacillus huizhouensis]|uniref:ComG operon protein 3 n=1 Tax=Peribacillus huizhouensis TaxID=1501239 RepID=A0ABR6CLH5_9BACI|nr:competence type IV pilus major pilin ComGC [Peribacillus huizhouensis]MBA9025410.1 competence protein ComGC [Peribacillus huizhouensis]
MNEKGFTLIEMLIVLFVISILLIITIPNILKNQNSIQSKGCDAYVKMAQSQVQAYQIDHNTLPNSLAELKDEGYLKETYCKKEGDIVMNTDGEVSLVTGSKDEE